MIDKVNFSKVSLNPNINNKSPKVSFGQQPDVFIKEIELSYSKDDIIEVMVKHSFIELIDNLLTKGYSFNSAGTIALDKTDDDQYFVQMGLTNFETFESENYKFSNEEFLEILQSVKDKRSAKYPEQQEQLSMKFEEIKKVLSSSKED